MRRIVTVPCLLAVAAMAAGGPALGQDTGHREAVERMHRLYEQAIADRDYTALAELYAEDGVHLPATGDILEGREAISRYFEEAGFTSIAVESERVDTVADRVVVDIGRFTVGMPDEAGGGEADGEYVVVAEVDGQDFRIHHIAAFWPRHQPDAPGQQ